MVTWMKALKDAKLTVKSARDALQVKGWLDTGNYALNWAISGRLLGGYPLGRTVEIFGDPGTGKSFLAARALAMVQEVGGVALLDDTEGAYNLEYLEQSLGVDVTKLAVTEPRSHTVKEHLAAATAFIKAYRESGQKGPGLLVLDSIAQLSTEHEMEEQLDKRDMSKASELKAFYRIVGASLFDLPILHLATNHTIANIGGYGNSRTTPGGGGPKFTASVRLDLRAINKIKTGAGIAGVICRVVVDKNRIVAPWKEVKLAIPFEQAIARTSGLVPLLIEMGVVKTQGQFLLYGKEKIGRVYESKEKFLVNDALGDALIQQHPALLEETDALLAAGKLARHQAEGVSDSPDEADEEGAA